MFQSLVKKTVKLQNFYLWHHKRAAFSFSRNYLWLKVYTGRHVSCMTQLIKFNGFFHFCCRVKHEDVIKEQSLFASWWWPFRGFLRLFPINRKQRPQAWGGHHLSRLCAPSLTYWSDVCLLMKTWSLLGGNGSELHVFRAAAGPGTRQLIHEC